jgi:hypothetical protein
VQQMCNQPIVTDNYLILLDQTGPPPRAGSLSLSAPMLRFCGLFERFRYAMRRLRPERRRNRTWRYV